MNERTHVLYLDCDDELAAVVACADDSHGDLAIRTVSSVDAALSALADDTYDCVVAELAVGDRAPLDVATALQNSAPETPIVAYTAIDFTDLAPEAVETVTTIVQKGDQVHRRFLLNKVRASVGEDDDETRHEELAEEFADESAGAFLVSADGQVVQATRQFDDLFPVEAVGVSPSGTLYDRLEQLFTNGPAYRSRVDSAVEANEPITGYLGEVSLPDGDSRYYACWSVPLGGRQLAFYRDVTADVTRREELDVLETLVELAHDGLYTVDTNARIEYCNRAYADMLGCDREELVGTYAYDIMDEGGLRKGQRIAQEVYEGSGEKSQVVEQRHRTRDGEIVWVAIQCAVLPGEGGTYGGLVNVARDVTERKERERQLEAQQDRLREKNETLETVAQLVRDSFHEPLDEAEQALAAATTPPDPDRLDRVAAALETVEAQISEHLHVTREQREADAVLEADVDNLDSDIVPASDEVAGVSGADTDLPPAAESAPGDAGTSPTGGEAATDDSESSTPDGEGTADESTDTSAEHDGVSLRVLLVDGDASARERLTAQIATEPDIAVDDVGSSDAAGTLLDGETYGCVVADPTTIETHPATLLDEGAVDDALPLIVYTDAPSDDFYEEYAEETASIVEKGDERNRAFLVEKLRSLTDVGRPGAVEIPWQADRVDAVGTESDLFAALVADGDVVDANRDVGTVFPGIGSEAADLHDFLRDRLVNDREYSAWLERPPTDGRQSPALLCELPTDDGVRFYRCWRWPLSATDGEDRLELYLDVTAEVDRSDRLSRARTLVERARDAIHVLDENAQIVYCNRAEADLFGYDVDELVGTDITKFVESRSLQRGQQTVQKLIENPELESTVVEMEMLRSDGEYRTFALNFTLTPFDEDGSYTGLMAVCRDVTEQKERERELRRRQERLRRKNQLLERFASIVSHDLRNPLTVATGHLELYRDGGDPESLVKVEESIDRMQEMLGELLSFTRMGGEIANRTTVDLEAVVTDAWETVDPANGRIEVAHDSVTVDADRAKLLHVFENLFRNVEEYAGEEVTVRVGGDAVGWYVADDGPGIPSEERDDVFEYGYSSVGGTGIGLAIVRDVIRGHGWDIEVGESDGGGARFDVTVDD